MHRSLLPLLVLLAGAGALDRPRVYVRGDDGVRALRAKAQGPAGQLLQHARAAGAAEPAIQAFTGLLDDNATACRAAIAAMRAEMAQLAGAQPVTPAVLDRAGRVLDNAMHRGAMVLDWCHAHATAPERAELQTLLTSLANMHSPFFPIRKGSDTIVGHACEGWVFTGQLPAGLAMDGYPSAMWIGALQWLQDGLLPVRERVYPAHKVCTKQQEKKKKKRRRKEEKKKKKRRKEMRQSARSRCFLSRVFVILFFSSFFLSLSFFLFFSFLFLFFFTKKN